jgi:hypothetical protein
MSIIPLSVSIIGIPARVNEITACPGSLHARMPTNESTNIAGNVYQANSFFMGRPAARYTRRTRVYNPAIRKKFFIVVIKTITRISIDNFVHGLTRENAVCRF